VKLRISTRIRDRRKAMRVRLSFPLASTEEAEARSRVLSNETASLLHIQHHVDRSSTKRVISKNVPSYSYE